MTHKGLNSSNGLKSVKRSYSRLSERSNTSNLSTKSITSHKKANPKRRVHTIAGKSRKDSTSKSPLPNTSTGVRQKSIASTRNKDKTVNSFFKDESVKKINRQVKGPSNSYQKRTGFEYYAPNGSDSRFFGKNNKSKSNIRMRPGSEQRYMRKIK